MSMRESTLESCLLIGRYGMSAWNRQRAFSAIYFLLKLYKLLLGLLDIAHLPQAVRKLPNR